MKVLVTGGAGFIGSHTCVTLLEAGHQVLVYDNFSNSSLESIAGVKEIVEGSIIRFAADVRDRISLSAAFSQGVDAVIHFAGLKAVGESVDNPLEYWDVNVNGTLHLLRAMKESTCRTLVFSSSATLYGNPDTVPIPETAPLRPVNPYGETKLTVERILQNIFDSSLSEWRIASLRYFNPVGAHPSGLIGEDPSGIPNNLFPYINQVAVGRRDTLKVFGGDYDTPDGTGVRDYIHVMDLAEGHLATLEHLLSNDPQHLILNLGSGKGSSVLDVVRSFEQASGKSIPYEIVDRRPGDAAITVADPSLAKSVLGWETKRNLDDMCQSGWAWQSSHPNGFN